MENQTEQAVAESEEKLANQTPPQVVKPVYKNKFFLGFVAIMLLVLLAIGGFALGHKSSNKPTVKPQKSAIKIIPTPNLNPGTGTLYGDIKIRLQEVIK